MALPDEPEPPLTVPPPAEPETAVLFGELSASPEPPECEEPPVVVVLLPEEDVLEEEDEEDELPDEPPAPLPDELAALLASPPDPDPAWGLVPLAWIWAARTSSTIMFLSFSDAVKAGAALRWAGRP
ncbi:MAG: hypothetical protein ACR2N4_00045 [Jatrophihabitans sp.]